MISAYADVLKQKSTSFGPCRDHAICSARRRLTVEIAADFLGAADPLKRAVPEDARSLGLKTADWE